LSPKGNKFQFIDYACEVFFILWICELTSCFWGFLTEIVNLDGIAIKKNIYLQWFPCFCYLRSHSYSLFSPQSCFRLNSVVHQPIEQKIEFFSARHSDWNCQLVNRHLSYEEEIYQQKVAEFKIPVIENYIYKFHSLFSKSL